MAAAPLRPSVGKGPDQHCHPMIRATAIEMAGELYDLMMKNNQQWQEWKRMHPELGDNLAALEIRFLELKWPELIEDARTTLARMLGTGISEELKMQIHDALVKDNGLRHARLARQASQASNRDRTLH
jgi:hypothetical protein